MALNPPLSMATAGPRKLSGLQQYSLRVPGITATTSLSIGQAIDGDQDWVSVTFTPDTTVAAHAANYWTFQIQNAGDDGSGSDAMMTAVTTEAASLSGITAQVAETFTISAAGTRVLDGEVVKLVFTKAAAAGDITLGGLVTVTLKRASTY